MHPHSVGNYKILETIADKGSYQVYLAKHKKLGRNTLLKVYSGADINLIERFEREAKIVADLDDDSIVAIYDFGKSGNRYFISMEYVEGCNLREYLKKHQLKDEEIISFSYQIAKSVSIFHEKGYIHRDLKPENILIDLHGKVKITDFGITLHGTLNRLTQEGDLFGTPLYMSPEQVNNLPLSPSSDVFALGIIFYEMATGINPFAADHYAEIFSKILTVEPPSLKTNNLSLPRWYSDLVGKMLHKNSDTRIQNARDIVNLFDQKTTISQQNEQKVNQDRGVQKTKFLQRTPLILIISLLLIAIVIFTVKYYDSQKSSFKTTSDKLLLTDSLLSNQDTVEMVKSKDQNNIFVNNKSSTGVEVNNKVIENAVSKKDITEEVSDYVLENTTVFIKTWPWCRVYLNYQLLDVTPMTSPHEVIPGNYLLSLQNPDYPAWSDSITIKPDAENVFNINLDSLFFRLKLKVIPWGEVFIDGKYMGTTPFTNPISLSRKPHILEVRNKYFETWEDSLIWDGQAIIEKFIVLRDNKRD